ECVRGGWGVYFVPLEALGLCSVRKSASTPGSPWLGEALSDTDCQAPDSSLLPLRALHVAYLRGGGSDPAVLAQMYDLQLEATALERAARSPDGALGTPHAGCMERYLLRLQASSPLLSGFLSPGSLELQRAHMTEMAQLHAEIGALRRDAERMQPHRAGRRSPPMLPPPVAPPLPSPPPLPLVLVTCLFSLPRRAGFVIFYDFLLGLDPTFFQVCLVAGLYRNGQEMGKPTPLPITYCQMGHSPPYVTDGLRGNSAILSAKQPVPRVWPSTSIALVTELQASGGFDAYGLEIQHLAPRGWAKINLFDQLHQLLSGRWKIPVRLLPVQSGLAMEQMNGIPQAGKAELYLRVVNARDADMQSMAKIDPGNASVYRYPPTVSGSPPECD
uniref:Coiled-coil domain containing 17 n=1 Tax=Pelusios castaneus TaxID=367368 RepID=A0A8C8SMB3_9SAUR